MSALNKITAERNQRTLLELVAKPGNDICADCKTRNPRWASHNLGIFICVNCASIHRKLGTHITKVKSLTLDEWTKEQVENMRQNGNVKSNAYYNPNEARHPPPTTMMDNERDSELEQYIRSKYEYKRFVDKSTVIAAKLGPSRSSQGPPSGMQQQSRAVSSPVAASANAPASTSRSALGINRPFTSASANPPSGLSAQQPPARSASQPFLSSNQPTTQQLMKPMPPLPHEAHPQPLQVTQIPSNNPVWDDLISLNAPSVSASLPLQIQTPSMAPISAPSNQPLSNSIPFNTGMSPSIQPAQFTTGSYPVAANPVSNATTDMGINAGVNPGFFQQGMAYSLSTASQFTPSVSTMPTGIPLNAGLTQQHFLQPQPTSALPLQQTPSFLSSSPQPMQRLSPMSISPGLMQQQGLASHSPTLQTPFTSGSPYGGNNGMGASIGIQSSPAPFAQPLQPPFGNFQQQHPAFANTPPNQFTAWMQASTPGQQAGGQRWGGM